MKQLLFLPLLALLLFACGESTSTKQQKEDNDLLPSDVVYNPTTLDPKRVISQTGTSELRFKDTIHDFGTINEGETVTCDFEFTNTGSKPLIITSVAATCGCTIPQKPEEPILPGKSDKIKVAFDATGKSGSEEKKIIVQCNDPRGSHYLVIKTNIRTK